MSDNTDKWIKFLDPENLKGNLMSSSLYIASFELFKDYVVETVRSFFCFGYKDGQDIIGPEYLSSVQSKDKSTLKATLLWLKEMEAIDESDIELLEELRKYRNKLSHKLMDCLSPL
ncbi:MAG: hypothetical protein HYU68_14395 [Bacteroidetes bacterium]|nr:hypothetical protein [Bacteroidota bacterium]